MGWIANVLLILSAWLVGSRNKWAFVIGSIGNLIYILRGYNESMYDLVFISIVMILFNVRAWIKWQGANPYWDRLVEDEKRRAGKLSWKPD